MKKMNFKENQEDDYDDQENNNEKRDDSKLQFLSLGKI